MRFPSRIYSQILLLSFVYNCCIIHKYFSYIRRFELIATIVEFFVLFLAQMSDRWYVRQRDSVVVVWSM